MPVAKELALLFTKGMCMGAADVVPGVSGGTIAFITGIYEELIDSIKSIGPRTLQLLANEGLAAAWHSINGNFLLVLFSGILFSVITLARVITHLLSHYPIPVWSFFFGLILVSALYIARRIQRWKFDTLTALALGTVLAYGVTVMTPATTEPTTAIVFGAGCLAICAMILPGISGSFILLMLGLYGHILTAVKNFDLYTMIVFALGCIAGLLTFSRLLSWMLHRYHALTLALLTGFMVGSLNKVWPWKQTLSFRVNSHGEQVPFLQQNVTPMQFANLTGEDPQLITGLSAAAAAIVLVLLIEFIAHSKSEPA